MKSKVLKLMFTILFITAHGIASLLANNSIAYDENHFKRILETSFNKVNKVLPYELQIIRY